MTIFEGPQNSLVTSVLRPWFSEFYCSLYCSIWHGLFLLLSCFHGIIYILYCTYIFFSGQSVLATPLLMSPILYF
jgi:hypothetical protein